MYGAFLAILFPPKTIFSWFSMTHSQIPWLFRPEKWNWKIPWLTRFSKVYTNTENKIDPCGLLQCISNNNVTSQWSLFQYQLKDWDITALCWILGWKKKIWDPACHLWLVWGIGSSSLAWKRMFLEQNISYDADRKTEQNQP